jgi:uncharacterized repeat protein (TIGR04138 family)
MACDPRPAYLAMLADGRETFSPAGLEYLLQLIRRTAFLGKGYRDLPAAELCAAFRRSAQADFGPFLRDALDRFGIRTGEELGRAVFLLAAHRCLSLKDGENLREYAECGGLEGGT